MIGPQIRVCKHCGGQCDGSQFITFDKFEYPYCETCAVLVGLLAKDVAFPNGGFAAYVLLPQTEVVEGHGVERDPAKRGGHKYKEPVRW